MAGTRNTSHSPTPSQQGQRAHPHAPLNPSGLREVNTLSRSPENTLKNPQSMAQSSFLMDTPPTGEDVADMQAPASTWSSDTGGYGLDDEEIYTQSTSHSNGEQNRKNSETTPLLGPDEPDFSRGAIYRNGTFRPAPLSRTASIASYFASPNSFVSNARSMLGLGGGYHSPAESPKPLTDRERFAQQHGIVTSKKMYLTYYIPFFAWVHQYKWSFLQGDLVSAITMASFYIPMALSYASNLGHIPPINGLYSFVFNPLIYAFLGSCPQMVVGPEAAGSLLLGSVVRDSVEKGHTGDDDGMQNARIAGIVTGMAGAVIFIAGLTRLGFLDSVLSRPFMRGFISSVGFIIIVDQLITETGLNKVAERLGDVSHGSSIDKIRFLWSYWPQAHGLTCAVAFVSFAIIMVAREIKKRMQPRYPSVAYVPDRFLVVVFSTILTYYFGWDKQGLQILGTVEPPKGQLFGFAWPFQNSHMHHVREAMSTSFLIALLGFFESSVAAKALGGGEQGSDGIQGIALSANRELIALGVANMVGGCFMALPAFGGYGRSKVNASTGGKTPMSSIFLSIITVFCVLFLLPYFVYLPKSVLSSMITVVAWTLIEEAPHDIAFFIRIHGFSELGLMFLIFGATIFYSLTLGIAIGVGLSVLSVIKHSTRPRIQILGRLPGTNRFENAESNAAYLEFIEGCLIVKIPEPLTFANTGDLRNRLTRLELYGNVAAHPALPRVRAAEHNRNIIFDIHGVTGLDGSGTQVLYEIVKGYRDRRVRVFFCRGPKKGSRIWRKFERSGIVALCGGESHFVRDVGEALSATEAEETGEVYANEAGDEGGG